MIVDEIAKSIVGLGASRIERVVYDFHGSLDECADVQWWFGEDLVRLYVGIDVSSISMSAMPWEDAFKGRESENAEYLDSHGRFRLVDVSARANYRDMIGNPIRYVWPLSDKYGHYIGVRLECIDVAANVYLVEDELKITWGDDVPLWK
ncbi:MAG: hypothetical protein ABJE66_19950 [Deltaproteobacteria bacterium]